MGKSCKVYSFASHKYLEIGVQCDPGELASWKSSRGRTFLKSIVSLENMRFKAKKVYGRSKVTTCPFCSRVATQKNEQGLDVCSNHRKKSLPEIKCTCGSWLEQRASKFGPYFNCIECGNMNYTKAMEIKQITDSEPPVPQVAFVPETPRPKARETTISTNDVEYFD
jgi:hypothetical protein